MSKCTGHSLWSYRDNSKSCQPEITRQKIRVDIAVPFERQLQHLIDAAGGLEDVPSTAETELAALIVCEATKEAPDSMGKRLSTLQNTMYKGTHGTVDGIWWHHGRDSGAPWVSNWSDGCFCLHGLAELDCETEIFTCRCPWGGCHQYRELEFVECHGINNLRCKSRCVVWLAQTQPRFGWGERGLVWCHQMGPDSSRLNLGSATTPEASQSSTSFLHRPTIDASTTAPESEQSKARLRYGHVPPSSEPSWGSNTCLKHQQLRCIRFAAGPCIGP